MNSLHRIALTLLTILATSAFSYIFYKTTSFIGRPLGRILTNLLIRFFPQDFSSSSSSRGDEDGKVANAHAIDPTGHDIEKTASATAIAPPTQRKTSYGQDSPQEIAQRTSAIIGATLGLLVFLVLFPLALVDEEYSAVPREWLEGQGESGSLVSAGLWVGWIAVRCWGETVVVLGVLAGVVKWLGLRGGVDVDVDRAGVGIGDEERDGKRRS